MRSVQTEIISLEEIKTNEIISLRLGGREAGVYDGSY